MLMNPRYPEQVQEADLLHRDDEILKMEEVMKLKGLVARKVTTVIEYFGEDENTCDTTKIFQTLQQFKSAVEVSKQTAERKARMRSARRNEG